MTTQNICEEKVCCRPKIYIWKAINELEEGIISHSFFWNPVDILELSHFPPRYQPITFCETNWDGKLGFSFLNLDSLAPSVLSFHNKSPEDTRTVFEQQSLLSERLCEYPLHMWRSTPAPDPQALQVFAFRVRAARSAGEVANWGG